MNYTLQYPHPPSLNSRPVHVTCFGQQVISKSEISRGLISTWAVWLGILDHHAVRKPKLSTGRGHVEEN